MEEQHFTYMKWSAISPQQHKKTKMMQKFFLLNSELTTVFLHPCREYFFFSLSLS